MPIHIIHGRGVSVVARYNRLQVDTAHAASDSLEQVLTVKFRLIRLELIRKRLVLITYL